MILFWISSSIQQQTPQANTTATGTVVLDSSGLVPLLLLPAPRQAGRACSASCVLFSYSCKNSFDVMTAESFAHFCCCDFWHQLKSLTIPEAIRHPTRETQEHRVPSTHSAAAPSAYGSFCRICDFLGRIVLLRNGSDQISVLLLGVVREGERRRCVVEMRTHTASYRARR